jgi:hypothetical protein
MGHTGQERAVVGETFLPADQIWTHRPLPPPLGLSLSSLEMLDTPQSQHHTAILTATK